MKTRAYGDLKDLIDNKPNWGRSLLERSLIITYVEATNLNDLIQAMNIDNDVLSASIIQVGELHASVTPNYQRGVLEDLKAIPKN